MQFSINKKIVISIIVFIVCFTSIFLFIINCDNVYAEDLSYSVSYIEQDGNTVNPTEKENADHGSVSVTKNENILTISVTPENNYYFSIDIYKQGKRDIENKIYNYIYNPNDVNTNKTEISCEINENVNIVVNFTITYLIRFYLYEDGEKLYELRHKYGDQIAYADSIPYRPSDFNNTYTFLRWEPEVSSTDVVVKDQDYYGVYSVNGKYYTIIFQDEDGTLLSSKKYGPGEKIVPPEAPTKASNNQYDYYFAGWDNPVDEYAFFDKLYVATYNAVSRFYPISTSSNHGSIILDKIQDTYEYGTIVNIETIPERGYVLSSIYLVNSSGRTRIENNSFVVTGESVIEAEFTKEFITYIDASGVFEITYAFLDVEENPTINIYWENNNKYNTYDLFTNKGYKNSYNLKVEIIDQEGNYITSFEEPITIKMKVPYSSDNNLLLKSNNDKVVVSDIKVEDGFVTMSMSSMQDCYVYSEVVIYSKGYQVAYIFLVVFVISIAIAACVLCGIELFKKNK